MSKNQHTQRKSLYFAKRVNKNLSIFSLKNLSNLSYLVSLNKLIFGQKSCFLGPIIKKWHKWTDVKNDIKGIFYLFYPKLSVLQVNHRNAWPHLQPWMRCQKTFQQGTRKLPQSESLEENKVRIGEQLQVQDCIAYLPTSQANLLPKF